MEPRWLLRGLEMAGNKRLPGPGCEVRNWFVDPPMHFPAATRRRLADARNVDVHGGRRRRPAPPPAAQDELLQEAAEILARVPEGNPAQPGGRYDEKFWERGRYGQKGAPEAKIDKVLVLLPGKAPSEAIDAIFKTPMRWSLDCATFAQAVYLFCLRRRLRTKFDEHMINEGKKTKSVMLRAHLSTGLVVASMQTAPPVTDSTKAQVPDLGQALKTAPNGSEIVFENPDAEYSSAFRHENAIKLETDSFIAHLINPGSPFANRAAIEKKLTSLATESAERRGDSTLRNKKQIVSVTWIVQYILG